MIRKKVGIYGGSFNPIHYGHVALAEAVCQCGVVDEVWFMVSPLNPLKKEHAQQLLPTDVRLLLTEMAIKNHPSLRASDFETRLPIPSYTVHTMKALKKQYPAIDFTLLIGQDNWQNFHRWVQADDIKRNYDIIVYGRPDDENTINKINSLTANVIIYKKNGTEKRLSDDFPFKLYDISSTKIREAFKIRNLAFAAKWLDPAVFRYVLENALYA